MGIKGFSVLIICILRLLRNCKTFRKLSENGSEKTFCQTNMESFIARARTFLMHCLKNFSLHWCDHFWTKCRIVLHSMKQLWSHHYCIIGWPFKSRISQCKKLIQVPYFLQKNWWVSFVCFVWSLFTPNEIPKLMGIYIFHDHQIQIWSFLKIWIK